MIFLLVEAEEDRLMAYQHTKRSNFVTQAGVDKLFGAQEAMARLGLDLAQCVGAGDTPMDNFLKGVGLAVQVGPLDLEFHGLQQTVRIGNSLELGELLFRLADLQRGIRACRSQADPALRFAAPPRERRKNAPGVSRGRLSEPFE